jgi:hypothetical protein
MANVADQATAVQLLALRLTPAKYRTRGTLNAYRRQMRPGYQSHLTQERTAKDAIRQNESYSRFHLYIFALSTSMDMVRYHVIPYVN